MKVKQVQYQLWYRLKSKLPKKSYKNTYGKGYPLSFDLGCFWFHQVDNLSFTFLNKSHLFKTNIDWNVNKYGKLWTYNICYFDYLLQKGMTIANGRKLMNSFALNYDQIIDGLEPYPTSLRIINWIKFISKHQISDERINEVIGKDTNRLLDHLEYHLMANHLLENAFALLFSSYYFKSRYLYLIAKDLLIEELSEQILPDGAHYELSPTYHQLMLYRVLDGIQLIQKNPWQTDDLLQKLEHSGSLMLGWLKNISFKNGDVPLVNDATLYTSPSFESLLAYANNLKINDYQKPLKESGYRMIRNTNFELFCDVGNIMPSYQPGHAHADSLNFILYVNSKPFLVEAGTSTYEFSERRLYERSTTAHNTVAINNENSSDVWKSFRVGKRANVKLLHDESTLVEANHDGYAPIGHTRKWKLRDDVLVMDDKISNANKNDKIEAFWHLHPNVDIIDRRKSEIITSRGSIQFKYHDLINIKKYGYAESFNEIKPAAVIVVNFSERLLTEIRINKGITDQ